MGSHQCAAIARTGRRCRAMTRHGEYCWTHLAQQRGVRIKQSTIAGAGKGLYAHRELAKGALVERYTGRYVRMSDENDWKHSTYVLELTGELGIDAARTDAAAGRMVNDCRGSGKRPNVWFVANQRSKTVTLRALRRIRAGEELFVAYGRSYWAAPASLVAALRRSPRLADPKAPSAPDAAPGPSEDTADAVPDPSDDAADGAAEPLPPELLEQLRAAAAVDDAYQAILGNTSSDGQHSLDVRDGFLWHGSRLVVPNDQRLRTLLLTEAHDAGTAGHTGVAATVDRLRQRVYWAGMHSDVHDYVVSCDSCQRNKVEQRRTAGLLRPPPVPDEPGYAINMDFVFGLPRTARGHTGYLSLTCRLSSMVQVALCSDDVTAEGAAQLVFNSWVMHYGLPAVIISDRDPRFTGRFWRALWALLDTQLHMSTAGHPQTDGKAENRQRTAGTMLRHYVDFEQSDWDEKLVRATFAMNHTRSVSTGLTPFEVMFRRAPRLPLDAALEPLRAHDSAADLVPAATNFVQRHAYLWAAARDNLLKAQADQKRHADQHRRDERYSVGDEVLLSTRDLQLAADAGAKRAAKLTARFVGPFAVTRVINDNAYELELPPQLRIHPVQNVSKLRRYVRSPARFAGRPVPQDRPPPDCVDPAGGEVYVVERLLAQRRSGRRTEYLVKWEGYPNEDSSWVPRAHLNAPDLLAEFEARQQLAAPLTTDGG
jgi:hypothetical protein